jgi:hypothetical protein
MRYLTAVCFIFLFAMAVHAQEQNLTVENSCSDNQVTTFISDLTAVLSGQPKIDNFFKFLDELEAKIATERWQCSGMVLAGENVAGKKSVILGPVSIPDGVYRVTMTTDGGLYMEFAPVSGSCDFSLYVDPGDASNGTEQIFRATDNCTALIQIETDTAWKLAFAPIATSNP